MSSRVKTEASTTAWLTGWGTRVAVTMTGSRREEAAATTVLWAWASDTPHRASRQACDTTRKVASTEQRTGVATSAQALSS
jgi:hypothetical protein